MLLMEVTVTRFLPLCVFLAGCATSAGIDATKMDQLQNSYELAHRSQWLGGPSDEALRTSIAAAATNITCITAPACSPANCARAASPTTTRSSTTGT